MQRKEYSIQSKEIICGENKDAPYFLDAFSYSSPDNKTLGTLFIVSRAITDDPTLSYVSNLVSSYIKREYFSNHSKELSFQENFEKALKKTNEIVYDLTENHNIKLDICVALAINDNIHITKIGNVKLILHRGEETKDIFNDVLDFEKSKFAEKEFSSLVSAKMLDKDKILFFLPNRRVSARESSIREAFAKLDSEGFSTYIKNLEDKPSEQPEQENVTLASSKKLPKTPFYFCGIYADVTENVVEAADPLSPSENIQKTVQEVQAAKMPIPAEESRPRVFLLGREIVKVHGQNILKKTAQSLGRWRSKIGSKNSVMIVAILVVAGIVGIWGFNLLGDKKSNQKQIQKEISLIDENVQIADSNFIKGEKTASRYLILESIQKLKDINRPDLTSSSLVNAISILDKLDKLSPQKPTLVKKYENTKITALAAGNNIYLYSSTAKNISIATDSLKKLADLDLTENVLSMQANEDTVIVFTKEGVLAVVNKGDSNAKLVDLSSIQNPHDIDLYQGNAYILTDSQIVKVPEVFKNTFSSSNWLKQDNTGGRLFSVAADQSIFILSDTKIERYYKGELIDSMPLETEVSPGSKIFFVTNGFVILDKEAKRLRFFDVAGKLQTSYDLSEIGEVKGADIKDRTAYIAGPDSVWKLDF